MHMSAFVLPASWPRLFEMELKFLFLPFSYFLLFFYQGLAGLLGNWLVASPFEIELNVQV